MSELPEYLKIDQTNAISKKEAIFQGKYYRITVLSDLLLRLEYASDSKFLDRPTELVINRNFDVPQMDVQEDEKFLVITTKYFKLQYIKEKPFQGSKIAPDANLKVSLNNTGKIWYYNHPEARNFNGSAFSLDDTEGNVKLEKGLYSTDGFATLDDSKTLVIDDEGGLIKRDAIRTDIYLFMYKRDFGLWLRDYFHLTGNPPLLPRYALGIWWNKNQAYSFEDIKDLVNLFKKYQIPLSVLLLGENWHIKDPKNPQELKTGFTFDSDNFPDPNNLTSYLHDNAISLGLNIDPHEGIKPHEEAYDAIATQLGLVDKDTIPFNAFDKKFINIYLEKLIKPLNEYGTDFYWIDYNNKDDILSLRALNYYQFNSYKENNTKRGLILSRNGNVASHKYPVLYSGQTIVSWKTLKYLPFFNSSSSNIGVSWWSHDIGGYKDGIEDNELYVRYVQFGTYSPIFRFSSEEGRFYKREPWKWDVKTLGIVRDYCKLRHRLIPYLYSEGYKYSKTGLPLIQPLYYIYPEIYDEPLYKNEYFFGSELFVCPITNKKDDIMNRSVERIFLPNGIWYDFKTGKKITGNKRYVLFFKDEDYPVFARSGSIIPLANLENNINLTNAPSSMEIHVFPGKSNFYNLYEDDGITRLYEEGYFINTKIEYNYLANNYTLIIRPTEGKSGIIPATRNYKIRFRNTKHAEDVTVFVDKDPISFDSYVDDADFIVQVENIDTTKQLTINCKGNDIEINAVRLINEDVDSIINDLQIKTSLKEEIENIFYSEDDISKKRIKIRKLKKKGLKDIFIRMFIKLLEYIAEI